MIIQRHEVAFARRAVRKGVVSGEQMLECIEFLRKQKSKISLKDIVIKLGYANPKIIEEIELSFNEKMEKTIQENQTILGGYLLHKKLGEGAMGSVYKAEHTKTQKIVAIKILDQELAEDKGFISRFLREAKNAAKLKHPNIVEAYDIGEQNGRYYFVMEFVDGCSLAHIIYGKGKIPERQSLIILKQLAQALEHAHNFSIVHRDIKPENILYSNKGIIKLCDLGLAKDISQDIYYSSGMTIGTLCYASPEQAKGEKNIDIRADIYSLGICLYQMLTATLPFEGKLQTPQNTHDFKKLPTNISILLKKMLSLKKENRHQSPKELLKEIELILIGKNIKKETTHNKKDEYRKSQIILTRKVQKFEWAWKHKIFIIIIFILTLLFIFIR